MSIIHLNGLLKKWYVYGVFNRLATIKEMKYLIIILLSILTVQLKGQSDTVMFIEVLKIDTTQPIYNYYTIDSTIYPKRNLIVISQVWVDKRDRDKIKQLQLGDKLTVEMDLIGPGKTLWGEDTVGLRGHARARNSTFFIDGENSKLKNKQRKSDFNPEKAVIRVDYFELKKIKYGG